MNGKKFASLWLAVVMVLQLAAPSLVWAVTATDEPQGQALALTFEGIETEASVAETEVLLQGFLQDYLLASPSGEYELRRWIGADLERDLMTEPIIVDGVSYLLSGVEYQGAEVDLPLLFEKDVLALHLVFVPMTEEALSPYDDLDNDALSTALAAMAAGLEEENGKQGRAYYPDFYISDWDVVKLSDTADVRFTIEAMTGVNERQGTAKNVGLSNSIPTLVSELQGSKDLDITAPEGYALSNWHKAKDDVEVPAGNEEPIFNHKSLDYYAYWEPLTVYTVTFHISANGTYGEEYQSYSIDFTETVTYVQVKGEAETKLDMIRTDVKTHAFDKWYHDSAFTDPVDESQAESFKKDMDYYGRWVPYVAVTFDVNGGEEEFTPDPQSVLQGRKLTKIIDTPTHASGRILAGWTTVKDDPETMWDFDDPLPYTGNTMTLYALWEDFMVVSFDLNGADKPGYMEDQNVIKGGKVLMPEDGTVEKEGHTIAGWYVMTGTEPSESDVAWNFNNSVNADMVLYPKWEMLTFKVTFRQNGGNIDGNSNSISFNDVEWNTKVTDIAITYGVIERPGYVFLGWKPDIEGFIGYWDFNSNVVTADTVLTAEWILDPNDSFSHMVITKNPKLAYEEGEIFNPDGLIVTYYMTSGYEVEVVYSVNTADLFTFSIPLTQQLTTEDVMITVSVEGLSVDLPIVVTEVPEYNYVYGKVYESTGVVATDVTVWLMQNGSVIRTTQTDSSGSYSFLNVGAGLFNVYAFQNVNNSVKSKTLQVLLTGSEQTLTDIELPKNLVSTVASGAMLTVNNLDAVAEYLSVGENGDAVVVVELAHTNTVTTYDTNYIKAYKSDDSEVGEFFSLSLTKRLSSLAAEGVTNIPILVANELIEITIALSEEDRHHYDYGVYRFNQGILEKLDSEPNADGEYVVVDATKSYLTMYVKKFSSFAVSYTLSGESDDWESDTDDEGYFDNELGEYRYTVRVYKSVNGISTSDVTQGGNFYLSETHPIHSTKVTIRLIEYTGYMVDSVQATDRNGNAVQVIAQEDGTYYFTQAGSAVDLVVSFINPSIPTTPDGYTGFFDVTEDDWYYNYVLKAAHLGYMAGVGNGYFNPNGEMTRGMIVQVLYNLAGKPSVPYEVVYSDLSYTNWYWEAVLWARSVGVADGYGGMFRAEDGITREELALMLYKYAQLDSNITQIVFPFEVSYADDGSVSTWAKDAIRWCTNKGVFVGKDLNYFYPHHKTSRAEVATCLLAYLNQKV